VVYCSRLENTSEGVRETSCFSGVLPRQSSSSAQLNIVTAESRDAGHQGKVPTQRTAGQALKLVIV
jgi:hypothetical protein